MQEIYGYIAGIIAAIVIGEMLLALLPDGNMKRFVQVAIGLFIACMLIWPLKSCSSGELSLSIPSYTQQSVQTKSAGEIIMDVYNSELENMNE